MGVGRRVVVHGPARVGIVERGAVRPVVLVHFAGTIARAGGRGAAVSMSPVLLVLLDAASHRLFQFVL